MKQLMTDGELSVFSGQLAMILHSGISTLEGIEILKEDAVSKEAGEILGSINEVLEQTGDLAEALRTSSVFPEYFIKMTEIGERSGTLEDVMDGLSSYYSRQDSLARSIRDALTYPLVLLAMLFGVLLVLMTQVMPVFREVFAQLGIEPTEDAHSYSDLLPIFLSRREDPRPALLLPLCGHPLSCASQRT